MSQSVIVQKNIFTGKGSFIVRGNVNKDFTKLSNKVLRESQLTAAAMGLYWAIARKLTLSDFVLYKETLRREIPGNYKRNGVVSCMGIRSFNAAWNQLKVAGYLKQYRIRTPEGFKYKYELLEIPDLTTPPLRNISLKEIIEEGEIVENTVEEPVTEAEIEAVEEQDKVGTAMDINIDVPLSEPEKWSAYYERKQDEYSEKYSTSSGRSDEDGKEEPIKPAKPVKPTTQFNMKYETALAVLKDQVNFDDLTLKDKRIAEELLPLLARIVAKPLGTTRIMGDSISNDAVGKVLMKLDDYSFNKIVGNIVNTPKVIGNMKGYMITTAYNYLTTYRTSLFLDALNDQLN